MILPNKVNTYKESVLPKFVIILDIVKETDITPNNLYKRVQGKFEDMGEYVETLTCLYALGKIDLDENRGLIYYVD